MKNEILTPYFAIFKGEGKLYSDQPKLVHPAIEANIQAGKIIAQRHLFDADETLIAVFPVNQYLPSQTIYERDF